MRHRAYPRGISQADKQQLMAVLGNEWPKATEPLQDHGQGPQPPATWRRGPLDVLRETAGQTDQGKQPPASPRGIHCTGSEGLPKETETFQLLASWELGSHSGRSTEGLPVTGDRTEAGPSLCSEPRAPSAVRIQQSLAPGTPQRPMRSVSASFQEAGCTANTPQTTRRGPSRGCSFES